MLAQDLLGHFERILHADPLIDHKLAISAEILPELYRAARDAYYNSRNGSSQAANLMSHAKALLILCPDMLTAWNSRKMVLSEKYDLVKLQDELQLCALILSYSPKNESTWSHRRWVLKQIAEQHPRYGRACREGICTSERDSRERINFASLQRSKMNYRAWRHRCWLIPYMTSKQVQRNDSDWCWNELKKSTRWCELHVADNCCFHYRRALLLALLDGHLENGEDSSLGSQKLTCFGRCCFAQFIVEPPAVPFTTLDTNIACS
ncbi:hypothetical protein HU200_005852 [Digitaria exilis]|uniref:Protein prenyltransferase alpha subunit repeat-containing protein 1 n=1 Tax=Digitaria exilis TaxID=1010633 RepID=A0A835KSK0_9POAL|nr:hypothetical protein HU200_005852 [Digitaria exilis]